MQAQKQANMAYNMPTASQYLLTYTPQIIALCPTQPPLPPV